MKKPFVRVRVPATSANLGPGFDVLGLALCLYNTVDVYCDAHDMPFITVTGEGAEEAPLDETNLVIKAFHAVFSYRNLSIPRDVSFVMHNEIPFARGLGSSSAAACSGLLAAQAFLPEEKRLTEEELIHLACDFDGHPDNTTAALLGGLILSCKYQDRLLYRKLSIKSTIQATVVIPDYELSTKKARSVLPEKYMKQDAIYNLGSLGFLLHGFSEGDKEALAYGLRDTMHVPYRLEKMPNMQDVIELAMEHKGIGATVSGAGSTIIIFHDIDFQREDFLKKIQTSYPTYKVKEVAIDKEGGIAASTAAI